MSWAQEDWTVGLSGRVLQKVKELQVQQERLSRENRQRQLQLDNSQAALDKQNAKYEEVRVELQVVQRELKGAREEVQTAVSSKERLSQELQTKQAQVCSLEGQLDAARTHTQNLTQEVKRLEAELEKLQNSSRSGDSSLFSTPCWNMSSPWESNSIGGRRERRLGHRGEGDSQPPHTRQLQFSDAPSGSLPRQQHKSTPHRHPSNQSDSFSTPLAAFPWERDNSRTTARACPPPSPQAASSDAISRGQVEQGDYGKAEDSRRETDTRVSELQSRVCALEEELRAEAQRLKLSQEELAQSRKELAAKDLNLQRASDKISLAHTRMAQESERASGAEQRLRQLQEELKCQRQNADSSRLQHQQRTKELEKQHQRDLLELQKEKQCLEKQQQQEVNKLNQELQQARTLHNALQAQADKVSLQKQALDKEVETLQEKLKWTEGQLQESQRKDAQTQAKLMEALHEAAGVAASLEQSRKRERALEEEGKRLTEERAEALHLLKELQDQKTAPTPSAPPVQVCPVGQSFSPPPCSSHHPRPSAHSKRPSASATKDEQAREEEGEERGAQITTTFPTDREPGEGIDSEHITVFACSSSECSQRKGDRGKSKEMERKSENETNDSMGCDSSGTEEHSSADVVLPHSSQSIAGTPTSGTVDDNTSMPSPEKTTLLRSEQPAASEDLCKENAALRSELQDVREELQKRLEDLDVQRRAEAEARMRLKQLSRKHSSQAGEREEQDRERKAELERERAETERLRKTLAALEAEITREREQRERKNRGEDGAKEKTLEDRESEMIEQNFQLKKQLAEVKAQLALERDEREREKQEDERKRMTQAGREGKELSIKLAELEAELEELKSHGKNISPVEKNLSEANSPLTYLTLHDDEVNSNIVDLDSKPLPSPEQHRLFCKSTNQRNMAIPQATADLIQEEKIGRALECSTLSHKGQTGRSVSDLDDGTLEEKLCVSYILDQREKGESSPSDLAKEVECLREKNAKETERANRCQAKLEALQNQVTLQTQQLTMAFDRQSQHITNLLSELQEKESTVLRQGEELQRCRQELAGLRAEREEEEKERRGRGEEGRDAMDETPAEQIAELKPNHEKFTNILLTTSSLTAALPVLREAGQPETRTFDVDRPPATSNSQNSDREALRSRTFPQGSTDTNKTQGDFVFVKETLHTAAIYQDTTEDQGGTAALVTNLLALQEENQQLKERIKALMVLQTNSPALQDAAENQENSTEPGNAATSWSEEVTTCSTSVLCDIIEGQHSKRQDGERSGDGEREEEESRAKEESGTVPQHQISLLQQQVVVLQAELQALSVENQLQAEELAVWRLASQPTPALHHNLPQTDLSQSETQDRTSAVRLTGSHQQPTDDTSHVLSEGQTQAPALGPEGPAPQGVPQSPATVTVIREDELLLSCSSNKLQGRLLASRMTHKIPVPKSRQPPKKTSVPQGYLQDFTIVDEESDKENLESKYLKQTKTTSAQHKEKREAELIQMYSAETGQQQVTRETKATPLTKVTEFHREDPEAKPNTEVNSTCVSLETEGLGSMNNASTQTEESLNPPKAPTASELHHAYTQTEKEEQEDEELVDSPPLSPVPPSEATAVADKMLFSGSFPIPADPARLAERIRRNRSQLSAAFDDTEYEPYGLPEVVMKGFADIPSGPSCPYIVRRALLGTSAVPLPQRDPAQSEETD
ncbi:centromere protein F isoform X2 [Myripristis murdjan]|uniref:centromere protein F isoform X2 n=1 Tax=Myripristis murdjan TaxID=586833 RepID=UPI0011762783|nr:centromere protein F-like isoform X2 [Myripristis murdjan]